MQLTLTGIVKSLFTGGYLDNKTKSKLSNSSEVDHTYQKGDPEHRGPCPGLNALANQGYLPRDGKNLTIAEVQHALETALHMDWLAAASICAPLIPLVRKDGTFDLVDTRRHNVIEHDASLTRLDFHQGDNYTFQPDMFEKMMADANGGPITHKSLAKGFVRRGKESRAAGAPRLPLNLWFVAVLQYVSAVNTAQTGGILTKEVAHAIYVEERFPEVVTENRKKRTTSTLLGNSLAMLRYVIFG